MEAEFLSALLDFSWSSVEAHKYSLLTAAALEEGTQAPSLGGSTHSSAGYHVTSDQIHKDEWGFSQPSGTGWSRLWIQRVDC